MDDDLLMNVAGLMAGSFDIDIERGPLPDASFIEQQASTAVYTGAKQSRLTMIIKFLSWQARHKVSDVAMDDLFRIINEDIIPKGVDAKGRNIENHMPSARSEARIVIRDVGFDYITIDACPCDEFLYHGPEKSKLTECPREQCKLSRYRTDMKTHKIPRKKMHYFPITPRLLALFRSPKYSRLMQWAGSHRSEDGWLRYPQDSSAWKRLEALCPFLLRDPRNVVFGLATDGFNPYGHNSASHSTWPFMLVLYNLPPELAIKAQNILLTIIIPGMELSSHTMKFLVGAVMKILVYNMLLDNFTRCLIEYVGKFAYCIEVFY